MKVRRTNKPMIITRKWCMPNKHTFQIKPIHDLILKYKKGYTVDPFSNNNRLADVTNDINSECDCDYHMEATDFLKTFPDESVDTVLYDPPYSPRQVSEVYKKHHLTVTSTTTSSKYWTTHKKEIGRIIREGGIVISCGWNSGGIGKKYGFEIVEILLVAHEGHHNDTIVTVERKKEHDPTKTE